MRKKKKILFNWINTYFVWKKIKINFFMMGRIGGGSDNINYCASYYVNEVRYATSATSELYVLLVEGCLLRQNISHDTFEIYKSFWILR